MRYILVYARQRVFVVGGWNTVKFNILPCSFICHWLQGSIFSRGKDIYFYLFLFFDSTVQENDGEFTSYRLASDKKFLSENDEISPSSSLMLGLLAKKICGLYLKQEKSYQQIKTSQYFPRPHTITKDYLLMASRRKITLPTMEKFTVNEGTFFPPCTRRVFCPCRKSSHSRERKTFPAWRPCSCPCSNHS
jgi:hypothetical protein